jgi:hypothetical protein
VHVILLVFADRFNQGPKIIAPRILDHNIVMTKIKFAAVNAVQSSIACIIVMLG